MTIKFGAEIEVNGVRPKWLTDDDKILVRWDRRRGVKSVPGAWSPLAIDAGTKSERDWRWDTVFALCLPADHFAYVAIERGFEPWGGGDAAPEDWNGGKVLLVNGDVVGPDWLEWGRTEDIIPIIGYRKKVAFQPSPAPTDSADLRHALELAAKALEAAQNAVAAQLITQQPTDQALTIRITGPQGSGKTRWAEMLRDLIPAMEKVGFPVPVVVDAGEEG